MADESSFFNNIFLLAIPRPFVNFCSTKLKLGSQDLNLIVRPIRISLVFSL